MLSPLLWDGSNLLFLYPDFQARESGSTDISLGLGFRSLINNQFILGANAFYDSTESANGGRFGQFGFGAEFFTQRLRARTNFYFPDGKTDLIDSERVNRTINSSNIIGDPTPVTTDPFATGYGIFATTTIDYQIEDIVRNESYLFEKFEKGMQGHEFEVGFLTPYIEKFGDAWLYGGYYHFNNPFTGTIEGPMARAELQLTKHLIFDAAWFDDPEISVVESNWTFGIRATIPIGKYPGTEAEARGLLNGIGRFLAGQDPLPLRSLESQMNQNIIRNSRVRLAESDFIENVPARVIDEERTLQRIFSESDEQETVILPGVSNPGFIDIIFVDANAAPGGDGTAERPFQDLLSAQLLAESRFASLGRTQGIYVTAGPTAYTDNIVFNDPGSRFALADTSITLPLASGRTFGGGTAPATWTTATGPALLVDSVGQFSFGGFNITTNSGPAPAVRVTNVPGPPLPPPPGVITTEAFHFLGGTTLTSTGGAALVIDDSGVSGSIASLKSSASTGNGVGINNMTGSLTVTGDVMVDTSTLDGIAILNTAGNFSVLGTTTLLSIPFPGFAPGTDGLDINDSSGTFTFASVDIDGWEDGVDIEDNTGQLIIQGGTIDGAFENAVEIVDSNTALSNLTVGANLTIGNDGINVSGTTGTTTSTFTNINIADTLDEGIDVTTTGGDHRVGFNGITIGLVDETGIDLDGFGGGLLTVTDFRDITITTPNFLDSFPFGDGGIFVDTVTFDANPDTAANEQVQGGNLSIGSLADRADGFGVVMLDPSGNLGFSDISIFNNGDFGLFVNTKFAGTTFFLGGTSGTVDTTGAPAMFLDPLTVDLTFQRVSSDSSFNNGVELDEVAGRLNIGSVSITNTDGNGFEVFNSSGIVTINEAVFDTIGSENIAINLRNNTGNYIVTGDVTISNSLQGIVAEDSSIDVTGTTSMTNGVLDGISIIGNGNASFGRTDIANARDGNISLIENTGTIRFGAVTIGEMGTASSGGGDGIFFVDQLGGSVTFDSLAIFEADTAGLALENNAGSFTVNGATTVTTDGGFGAQIVGQLGSYSFGSLDITATGATSGITFFDTGSEFNFTATQFSVTGDFTAGSVGVDIDTTAAGSNIVLGDPVNPTTDAGSVITGYAIGIRRSAASLGTFIFGDGEGVIDTNSNIGAGFQIQDNGGGTFNTLDF